MAPEMVKALVHVATVGNMALIDLSPTWTKADAKLAEEAIQEVMTLCES